MPQYRDTVHGNLTALNRRIVQAETAPLGPISVGPDEGSIEFYNAAGDILFNVTPVAGGQIRYRGGLRNLTAIAEEQSDRLDSHDGRITAAQDQADFARASASNANNRAQAAQDQADFARSSASNANNRAQAAQDTADKGVRDAATAQAQADYARSSASNANNRVAALEGKSTASPGDVSDLKSYVDGQLADVKKRLAALEAWRRSADPTYSG